MANQVRSRNPADDLTKFLVKRLDFAALKPIDPKILKAFRDAGSVASGERPRTTPRLLPTNAGTSAIAIRPSQPDVCSDPVEPPRIAMLEIDRLQFNPDRPRRQANELNLDRLSASIAATRLMHPILVVNASLQRVSILSYNANCCTIE